MSSKKQKKYYSGKKKSHTLKIQIVADEKKKDILSIAVSGGNKHDFRLFKESIPIIPETTFIIADKGYQGISDIHYSSLTPVKAAKNYKLNDVEKVFNSDLSKRRIFIEHINRYIKCFRILSYRYRNRRRRFTLRVSLICAIYNFQHTL
ncbi:MAG: transposase [Ruminococcus sp.]|nr:transposase [Ruminococcus sp.]